MSTTNFQFRAIPTDALQLIAARVTLSAADKRQQDGEDVPITLLARTGDPIEHPWWGRIVHDMSGLKMHKPAVPIDYCHDAGQLIGVAESFLPSPSGLIVKGRLFGDDARALEVIGKARRGLPYEASINFAGEGIEIEEVPEGQIARVNGFDFEGPGFVVRSWPLRGIAVCPYGADPNTKAELSAATIRARFCTSAASNISSRQPTGFALGTSLGRLAQSFSKERTS